MSIKVVSPYETHPDHPESEKPKAKDIDSFTREEVARVVSKLVKRVQDKNEPMWGYKRSDVIKHIEEIIPNLDKLKKARKDSVQDND